MTNLTEQWNKGELTEGDYYIKRRNGLLIDDNIDSYGVWRNSIDEDIVEVLTPVPTFEEWQAKLEENAQLKELLKECREEIGDEIDDCTDHRIELFGKINEMLK